MSEPILPLRRWPEGIQQASVPANDNALREEAMSRPCLGVANDETGSDADGDVYIVGSAPTGAFAAFEENDIALARVDTGGTSWHAWAPVDGLRLTMSDGSRKVYVGESTDEWQDEGGGGGGADWGDIGGTLSAQTDLQAALDDRVEETTLAATGGAALVGYDNTTSGLTATDVQDAIDELEGMIAGGGMSNPMTTAGDIITGGSSGTPQRLAAGTDTYVLTMVSGSPAWAASGGGGGLTGFTASLETASPNNSRNASVLLASGGSTNQDAVLQPKGNGAIQGQLADATTVGGSKRGTGSVDLQLLRNNANQVASGNYAALIAGYYNSVTGNASGNVAGISSSVTGVESFNGGGNSCTVSGSNAANLGGNSSTVSGTGAVGLGGLVVTASGDNSVASGSYGNTRSIANSRAHGCASGKQVMYVPIYRQTTDATPGVLTSNGSAATAANQWALPSGRAAILRVMVVARQSAGTGAGDCAAWDTNALVKNIGGTTTIVGSPTVTQTYADSGASAWAISITADNTNDAIQITVTGQASKTIQWTAYVVGPEA